MGLMLIIAPTLCFSPLSLWLCGRSGLTYVHFDGKYATSQADRA